MHVERILGVAKKKISVAYISPGWPASDFPNGIVTYVQNIISGIGNAINTNILAHSVSRQEQGNDVVNLSEHVPAKNIWNKIVEKVLYKLKLRLVYRKLNQRKWNNISESISNGLHSLQTMPDLLEVEESFGLANWLIQNTDIPVVTRLHGPWFINGPIMQLAEKDDFLPRVEFEGKAIQHSHAVTSPSLAVLNAVREHYGIALADARVIPNPVGEVEKSLQWKRDPSLKPTLLFVGRFDLIKGGDLAIDAFKLIAQQDNDIEFLFVGPDRGLASDGQTVFFEQYVDDNIKDSAIKERIKFLGHCDSETITKLRRTATVTIVTSRYENFPMTLLEALSTGCPTVATDVGGIGEILIDGFNGLLAKSDSPEDIAQQALSLLGDPERAEEFSKHAITDCRERFSPEVVAKQTVEFYQSVLSQRN